MGGVDSGEAGHGTGAEGILEYPPQAGGFGRRLPDVFRVQWVIPEVQPPATDQKARLAEIGVWPLPSGIYSLSILRPNAPPEERRLLLGDRRRRHRTVDRESLAYEERGSGERRKGPDEPGWH